MRNKFFYEGKTGIARTKGFEHKLLAEYSVNIGNICEFDCTYCYVPSVTMKQKSVKDIMDQGFQIGEFSSSREMDNVLSTVTKDLKRIKLDDVRTVFFCTTCDPCGNMTQKEISREAIKLIMEKIDLSDMTKKD